jgi:hypothetical protein
VPPIGKERDMLEKLFYQTVGLIFCQGSPLELKEGTEG